ncbi:MAG: PaaI family thioesterase [Candidatus Acetothermia bacterium]
MRNFDWTEDENRCFGCGVNPWGLKLDFEVRGEEVYAQTELDENYQGFKGTAHGGIIATLLDEASAWAIASNTGYLAPSYSLECRFLQPVPLEKKIEVSGRVEGMRHRIVTSSSQVRDESGDLLAKAKVKAKVLEESVKVSVD